MVTETFFDRLGLPVTSDRRDALDRVLRTAHEAWPSFGVSDEAFIDHLTKHAGEAAVADAFLASVHAGDLYMACAVSRHDRTALAAFEGTFMVRVPDYVLRLRTSSDVIDEVMQTLRERLILGPSPKIAEYSGKGALGGWLRVVAVRTALNHLRSIGRPMASSIEDIDVGSDPELMYIKERANRILTEAFTRVLAAIEPNERAMLRLHYIDGLTIDRLAESYKVPRSTIHRRLMAVRQQLLDATISALREERRMTPSTIASVIRLARSQLQVTISRWLE